MSWSLYRYLPGSGLWDHYAQGYKDQRRVQDAAKRAAQGREGRWRVVFDGEPTWAADATLPAPKRTRRGHLWKPHPGNETACPPV